MRFSKKSRIKAVLLTVTLCLASLSASTTGTIKVACVGDSDTFGQNLPDREYNHYPAQLERILRNVDSRFETRNFGISGATVLQRGDNPYMNNSAYNWALEYEPDVVVFEFGGNASRTPNRGHIAEHYVSDYNALIDSFAQLPSKPKIVICQVKGTFTTNFGISPTIIAEQLVPLIAEIASARDLPLIDLYSLFSVSPELYLSDNIHANIEGTALMAQMVAAELLTVRVSPDLTGDFKVDMADLTELIAHLGTTDPAFDLAPFPNGDGLVDYLDLEGFMEFWGEELSLVAHWPLDEADGKIAQNAADWRTGVVEGDPLWLPHGGRAGGALELDGIDDYVRTDFGLNPADGPFSVFAWVKGGAPGQVIMSQADSFGSGETWLSTDALGGKLMSEIVTPPVGRNVAPAIASDFVITDGTWRHIGFVWDGAYRHLYANGVEVAQDSAPLTGLRSLDGGLYFGVADSLTPTAFWAGLIDDIRIYNRALSAEQVEAIAR